jgi:hypothetical protein
VTEDLLMEYGQTMQQAAQMAYNEGTISKEWLMSIMAERKKRKVSEQGIELPEYPLEKLFLKFLDFIKLGKAV